MLLHQNLASEAEQATAFLETLFPRLDVEERIEVRYKLPSTGQPMHRTFLERPNEAADFALARRHTHQVYVGVAPRQGEVGTKEGVLRLFAIWGDLDIKGHHTSGGRVEQLSLPC